MKKKIIILLSITILFSFGCDKEVVSENNDVSNKVEEKTLKNVIIDFIKNDDSTKYSYFNPNIACTVLKTEKIIYAKKSYFILDNGDIYTFPLDKRDHQNPSLSCQKYNTPIKIKEVRGDRLIDNNGNLYVFVRELGESKCNDFLPKCLLLQDKTFINDQFYYIDKNKYPDGNNYTYNSLYALKSDGNIYDVIFARNSQTYKNIIYKQSIAFSKNEYGFIKSFHFWDTQDKDKSNIKFSMFTDDNYYFIKKIENDEHPLKLVKSNIYAKYKDEIKFANEHIIILKDNTTFDTNILNLMEYTIVKDWN